MSIKRFDVENKGCPRRVSTQGKRKLAAALIGLLSLTASTVFAAEAKPSAASCASGHGSLAEVGAKLADGAVRLRE